MDEIIINGISYIKKDNAIVNYNGEKTISSRMIGKNVIVRSINEGINAGTVVLADDTGVELKNCRRIWYHRPKDKALSWYEGISVSGLSIDSKVSNTVKRKVIIEDYSMTECEDEAFKSIMSHTPNPQS